MTQSRNTLLHVLLHVHVKYCILNFTRVTTQKQDGKFLNNLDYFTELELLMLSNVHHQCTIHKNWTSKRHCSSPAFLTRSPRHRPESLLPPIQSYCACGEKTQLSHNALNSFRQNHLMLKRLQVAWLTGLNSKRQLQLAEVHSYSGDMLPSTVWS